MCNWVFTVEFKAIPRRKPGVLSAVSSVPQIAQRLEGPLQGDILSSEEVRVTH